MTPMELAEHYEQIRDLTERIQKSIVNTNHLILKGRDLGLITHLDTQSIVSAEKPAQNLIILNYTSLVISNKGEADE